MSAQTKAASPRFGRAATLATVAAALIGFGIGSATVWAQSSVASPPPPASEGAPTPSQLNPLPAASDIHTVSPLPDGQWTTPAGDLANTRYSTLQQINATNVGKLKVISVVQDGIPHGHEGQPLVIGSIMYMVTPFPNNLIAIDLSNPNAPVKWTYEPNPDPRAVGKACCDTVNRGPAYADGKIIYSLLDDEVVAVDAKTGSQVWRTKVGSIKTGETLTGAPLIVHDKVIIGDSGGEMGVRGWVTALNVSDGKIAWRAYNVGSDKDCLIGPDFKPFYTKDRGKDLGLTTWPPEAWKIGGGTVWGYISYDPETNLIFYGTANPGPWNPSQRPGANEWTSAIVARNPDTGMARWAYQVTAHDAWDYDSVMEEIAVDMPFHGQMRKLLLHPGRNGFMMVLDRTDGQLLAATKYEPTNWAHSYDLKTGKPMEDPNKRPHIGGTTRDICPSSTGAKDFIPSAFDPETGLLYIPAHNTCMDFTPLKASYIAGTPYLGSDVKMYPGPGGYQGELVAWDVADARPVWTLKDPVLPVYSGVLATAGNLVFYGTMEGWFRAVDARTGKVLWQFKTGSGIVGNPMTFVGPDGKQYVAVYSGIGGWMGATAQPDISADDPTAALGVVGAMSVVKKYSAPGDSLYIFGL